MIFRYGTSGFRANSSYLAPIVFRSAFYAGYRSRVLGKPMGLMITASHNPWQDNGVKLVESDGQMLKVECEAELEEVVNNYRAFEDLCAKNKLLDNHQSSNSRVVIGTDTRPSAGELLHWAKFGCESAGVEVQFHENITTPFLHLLVAKSDITVNKYISIYCEDLSAILKLLPKRETDKLFVDCANGVASLHIDKFHNEELLTTSLNTNTADYKLLNKNCGADYVKIERRLPTNFDSLPPGARCATLDGDADRALFFYPIEDGSIRILDGDHIAALFTKFIIERFTFSKRKLSIGVVQTAYANGNSTRYFAETLGLKPVIVKTGVKFLDHAARSFDIGVYFEANGHGTVTYNEDQLDGVDKLLSAFLRLINPLVGDGITNVFAVEVLLRCYGWSIQDWEKETYTNIPSTQLKVPVQDRAVFVTHDDRETELIAPAQMQTKIDAVVSKYPKGRAFVRPSGTEEIVRVYAEAETQEKADELAETLAQMVRELNANL